MEPKIKYFYFDYGLTLKCECGRTIKAWGTNHTNIFKCKCGIVYKMVPKVARIE